jgi:DNA polymerase-1
MERAGVRVAPAELERQKVELAKRADDLRDRIMQAAGAPFNPDSPKQLAEVLFDRLRLPKLKQTKTGPSTDVSVLTELAAFHEVPGLILDYRQVTKLLGTYLEGLGQCINPRTGRVHTSFHQTGTATGRLSSSDPNLQNIPIRTELGKQIRSAFMAEPGNLLISADYSQVELRVLAHLSGDPTLRAAFEADQDVHRIVAAEVFHVRPEEVTPPQRAKAKTVNFGIIYGQTAFGLAASLRIGRKEAQEFIDAYKARFTQVEAFLQACIAQAQAHGYVETLSGRRRRIADLDSANPGRRALAERLAINSVVQGSAADLIKIAMINIYRRLRAENSPMRMLLQIHDELLFEGPESAVAAGRELVVQEMTGAMKLAIPLKVDVGVGPNWRDAKA